MNSGFQRRYARHIVLPEIGEAGQEKLAAASMLVIGAGGLGCNALTALAACGVGRLGIVDHDRVELSNLPRQLLYEEADIGRRKAEAAADRLGEMNSACRLEPHVLKLDAQNALPLVRQYDMVLDGSDNFATRFALADACMQAEKPLISAAISGFEAQLSTFKPYLGAPHPCYRCFLPQAPEREITCAQEGIIGPLAPMIGSMQALEAVKECLGLGESLSGSLLIYNALASGMRRVRLKRDAGCAYCAT